MSSPIAHPLFLTLVDTISPFLLHPYCFLQVLAENNLEASLPLHRFVPHGGLKLSFQPEYNLDASNVTCEEIKYLCASFNKNELAITRHGIHVVPFNVYGVRGEFDPFLDRANLIGCRQFTECIGKLVSLYSRKIYVSVSKTTIK